MKSLYENGALSHMDIPFREMHIHQWDLCTQVDRANGVQMACPCGCTPFCVRSTIAGTRKK